MRASLVAVVGVRPDVPVALRARRVGARLLEPRVVGRRVVHDEVGDHAHAALVRLLDELAEVVDRPVVGMDREEVGDVVAAVAQRRLVHRQQPDAVDAEPLQVVELVDQPAEVAGAVVVAVEEAADVDLVEDRALEPERVALEPLLGHQRQPPTLSTWLCPGCEPDVVAADVPRPRRRRASRSRTRYAGGRPVDTGRMQTPSCAASGSRLTTTIDGVVARALQEARTAARSRSRGT